MALAESRFPPVEQLLPHGPPMLLVDSIVDEIDDGLICKAVIADDFVFLRDGEASVAVCVELVAQTIGCYAGLRDHRAKRPASPGLLVGIRSATFLPGAVLRSGDELRTTVRSRWVQEPVASFTGEVVRGEEVLATVEMSVAASTPEMLRSLR